MTQKKTPPLATVLALIGSAALAQSPPDAGRILQETRPAPPRSAAQALPPIQAPGSSKPSAPAQNGETRVQATQFDFSGNSVLSVETLRAAVAAWVGRSLNFGDLLQAVEAVEARYKQAGYFLARANLPPQNIKDGSIEIGISEGRLGETRLEGESRVASDVVFRYLDRLPGTEVLKLSTLERQVLLINELAGGQANLDLQAGGQPGSTDVVLVQQVEPRFSSRLDANNHGLPSTGVNRLGLSLNANSLFNQGERISVNGLSSDSQGLVTYGLRGELPIGGDGWRLTAGASRASYSLGGTFASLDASGTADSLRLGASYPLVRSMSSNVRLLLEADQSKLVDQFRASHLDLDKQSSALSLSTSADWLDELAGGGSSRIDLVIRSGQLDLGASAAAQDAPPNGAQAAGQFSKVTLTASRQQTLTRSVSLQLQLTAQSSNKNLDSSEKISFGGAALLPGYASGEASADSAQHIKLAVRWQALPQLAITAFTDYANLQLAQNPLPGAVTTNQRQLSDIGISADWQLSKAATANIIIAQPGKETTNPADNDKPRLWLSLSYGW